MLQGKARLVVLFATILLPWRIRRLLYIRLFGWRIAPSARIGRSFVDVDRLTMAPGSSIGHLNVIRNMPLLEVGEGSGIHQWNWITTSAEFDGPPPGEGRFRGLKMGSYSAILLRHYLDCSGGITIGNSAALAGVRSTLLTHQANAYAGYVMTAPIEIGEYCLISSDVRITPGSVVPPRSIVAMGAVVTGALPEAGGLYGGVPAKLLRSNVGVGGWFSRVRGQLPTDPRETRTEGR